MKTKLFPIRFSKDEFEHIKKSAEKKGLKIAELIRERVSCGRPMIEKQLDLILEKIGGGNAKTK